MFFHRHLRAALGLAALAALTLLGAAPAAAQGAVKSRTGVWDTRCETPPGASQEQCALVQTVVDQERPNISLVVIVLKTADRKSRRRSACCCPQVSGYASTTTISGI